MMIPGRWGKMQKHVWKARRSKMDEIKYEKIGEVNGQWKAEIIESFLKAQGIEVELIQEANTHYLNKGPFDLVQILVPNKQAIKARELLKSFDEFQPDEGEDEEE
jgi:hypothetical protein